LIAVVPIQAEFRDQLQGLAATLLVNPAPERGIGSSIALGMGALSDDAEAVLIAVADQPLLSVDAVRSLLSSFRPGAIVAPRYADHSGNPRIFDRRFFSELASLNGDRGGQSVADAHPEAVLEVALPEVLGPDVDRPSDWARLGDGPGSGQ
jgi:CTP:molybdopterin cytidylyltransferase MocA